MHLIFGAKYILALFKRLLNANKIVDKGMIINYRSTVLFDFYVQCTVLIFKKAFKKYKLSKKFILEKQ